MLINRPSGRTLAIAAAILLFAGLIIADGLVAFAVMQNQPAAAVSRLRVQQSRIFLPYLVNLAQAATPAAGQPVQAATVPTLPAAKIYVVQDGDTLYAIARDHGVSVDDLVAANQLDDQDFIAVGQELVIPAAQVQP